MWISDGLGQHSMRLSCSLSFSIPNHPMFRAYMSHFLLLALVLLDFSFSVLAQSILILHLN